MSADFHLRIFPDRILRGTCQTVKDKDIQSPRVKLLISKLDEIMRQQAHGIGIAAPQIGSLMRIAIVDLSLRNIKHKRLCLINPEILNAQDEVASREGCMSVPDYRGDLKRYQKITLKWTDEFGGVHKESFEGIEAICIQHEVDHLNGKLFIDRIASLKRDLIPRKIR